MFTTSKLFSSLALAGLALAGAAAHAQSLDSIVRRDASQETRIRNGLQDGSLSTREAALLQSDERHVDRLEARALKDGKLTDAERQRIERAENRASRDIYEARHNGIRGNPLSDSSQRMQQSAQRDINQERRISHGIEDGQLNRREVGALERGQARVDGREFRAGRDGYVSAREASRINRAQNLQSERIHAARTEGHG